MGHVLLRVKGGSMRPFIRGGSDVVELVPVSGAALRRGMVVLFRIHDKHILHRIRRIDADRLTIKGDGNYRTSEIVTRADVVAMAGSLRRENAGQKNIRQKNLRRGVKEVHYRSARWRLLSALSLTAKLFRTLKLDLLLAAKKIFHNDVCRM